MNYSINQLAIKQAQFASNQKLLVQAVTSAEAATKNLNVQVPDAAAKSVGVQTNKLAVQVKSLKSTLSSQGAQLDKVASSVVALGSQLKSFESQVDNVSKLNADVEALITLERDKYLDLLRRQVELEESRLPVEEELEEEIDDSIVVYPYVSAR
jgi:DNA repair exonuclease SbcCD ATPase subunit